MFSKLGIKPSHRVALFLPNIPAFIIACFGIQKIGAICVPINSSLMKDETKYIIEDSGADVVITTEALRSNIPLKDELPGLRHVLIAEGKARGDESSFFDLMDEVSSQIKAVDMAPCDPCLIMYTSGTTGVPKGVTISNGNLLPNISMCSYSLRLCSDDHLMLCLPISHAFAFVAIMHTSIHVGATLVLHREFDPEKIAKSIISNKVTLFFGAPVIYNLLYGKLGSKDAVSLKTLISAAALLSEKISKKWRDKYGLIINEIYGLTETLAISHNHFIKYKQGSAGAPFEGIDMKVVDDNGCDVPHNEAGEIVVKGPNVMLGYWNKPEETAAVIKEGWFYTGDIGRMDKDGYFFITDRSKDMINVGGQKVFPSEIEKVLLQHEAVADAAVYGVPDEILGEEVRASVVLKPGEAASEDDIQEFCRLHVAGYRVPQVEITDSIPKNKIGKVLKRLLKEKYESKIIIITGFLLEKFSKEAAENRNTLLKDFLCVEIKRLMGITPEDKMNLFDSGMTSIISIRLANRITKALNLVVPGTLSIEYPTLDGLTTYLQTS